MCYFRVLADDICNRKFSDDQFYPNLKRFLQKQLTSINVVIPSFNCLSFQTIRLMSFTLFRIGVASLNSISRWLTSGFRLQIPKTHKHWYRFDTVMYAARIHKTGEESKFWKLFENKLGTSRIGRRGLMVFQYGRHVLNWRGFEPDQHTESNRSPKIQPTLSINNPPVK